jgi:hypothetical protein
MRRAGTPSADNRPQVGDVVSGLTAELLEALDDTTLDQLASRIADKLADRLATHQTGELINANELAHRIGRGRDYVYANADHLGAIRLGDGPRPRLAFRWPHVLEHITTATPAPTSKPKTTTTRPRRKHPEPPLLPVRGSVTSAGLNIGDRHR